MKAALKAIEFALPAGVLTNAELAALYPDWPADKIELKTGIRERHIAGPEECASDLAVAAGRKLFESGVCKPVDIDFLLLCTQSPDYFLPTTACLVQHRLGLPKSCGAFDFNLGCSGFVYGLSLAKGLIETGQAKNVLLATAETYSKFIHPGDKSTRTLFGDAAAVALITSVEASEDLIGPFVFGTDGSGGPNLIVPTGGIRKPVVPQAGVIEDENGNQRTENNLFMNGPEIFTFTLRVIGPAVEGLLLKAGLSKDQVDLWVFHQANRYMLEHIQKKLRIPPERFPIVMASCGNTVSSTIPLALKHPDVRAKLRPGAKIALVGFGVGYSWGATILRWS